MRELPPEDELLRPFDHAPIIYVPAGTWRCLRCDPDGDNGARTTVDWIGAEGGTTLGRCRECGSKFQLAQALTKNVPSIAEQERVHGWRPPLAPGPPETSEVSGRCLKCNRERIWPTTIYGKYETTPAVMRDPLIPRNYIGSRGISDYD